VRAPGLAIALGASLGAWLAGCAPRAQHAVTRDVPAELQFVSREQWGAKPPLLPMRAHEPVRLTIHHTGTSQDFGRDVGAKLRGLQAFSQRDDSLASGRKKPAWPDVPYHYYVAVDGSVGEGRDWHYAGDSNTPYDPAGHLLVVVEGNFQKDSLTSAQRRTLDVLVPALATRFGIPGDRLASHRDYARTDCPGERLYAELPRLRTLIPGAR
jgi:N-acetylmuramoyl-L-alanine amidase